MRMYVAGAWVEQHQRARPWIARLREIGVEITCDWTRAEGDVCACGHHRSEHAPAAPIASNDPTSWRAVDSTRCEHLRCHMLCGAFNGIGVGGDSQLSIEDRVKYARADLEGVVAADVVWLLAANDKGACGSWVEFGAALVLRQGGVLRPHIVVSGPKARRTIFTELADELHDTDEAAFASIAVRLERWKAAPILTWGGRPMREGRCPPDRQCVACDRLGKHLEPVEAT